MKKEIAFFDFDGTITTKDTLLEFIKFTKGPIAMYAGFAINLPYLIAYKLKIITNQRAKEKVLAFFFKNTTLSDFNKYCDLFATKVIPTLLRPEAITTIKEFKKNGIEVTVVSASPENWILPWAKSLNLNLLATQLEVNEQKLTGKIKGFNCHGQEKVTRITSIYNLSNYGIIHAYGDSSGDTAMLKIATNPSYKPFRNK